MAIDTVFEAMEEFDRVVKSYPSTDAPDRMVRLAGCMPADVAITALARLFTIVHTRGEYDRAKLARLRDAAQEQQARGDS